MSDQPIADSVGGVRRTDWRGLEDRRWRSLSSSSTSLCWTQVLLSSLLLDRKPLKGSIDCSFGPWPNLALPVHGGLFLVHLPLYI